MNEHERRAYEREGRIAKVFIGAALVFGAVALLFAYWIVTAPPETWRVLPP